MQTADQCRVAIIGTRTPDKYQAGAARNLAQWLSELGCIITTGAALGTDNEAMTGATPGHLEVYLPWKDYNTQLIPTHAIRIVYDPAKHVEWAASVKRFHPAPHALTRGAFALHARNYGITYKTVAVVAFPDEKGEGGTGQGIRIARGLGIHVVECRKGSSTSVTLAREIMASLQDILPRRGPSNGQNEHLSRVRPVYTRPSV